MANPFETLTKVVGFGFQQGASVLGKAVSTVQGITGRGGADEEQEQPPSRAEQQRQRTQRAASQRRSSRQPKPLGDAAITRKVETELFRSAEVDKGKINVNTADGIVWLRGEAKNPEQVKELEAKAAAIPEVKRVENLLHLPNTPAPTRTDTPPTQRKTRRTKPSPQSRKVTPSKTTSEPRSTTGSQTDPAPADLTTTQSGRTPSPLGDEPTGGNGGSPTGS
jgi:hypothetical protein